MAAPTMTGESDVKKLQRHLALLREEYVKLQNKLLATEKNYQMAAAAAGLASGTDTFVSRLLQIVSDLYDKELYSDLKICLNGQDVKCHKFVLAARSDTWGVPSLQEVSSLDFTDLPANVGTVMLQWVYTDSIPSSVMADDTFILELMRASSKFKLKALQDRCEKSLISSVSVRNCIRYYEVAEDICAENLKHHCSELISNHWGDFSSEDFSHMPAPLLYSMFKSKTLYPLHTAIRMRRDDVVFLYLVENDSKLPAKLNEVDQDGDLPLDLALCDQQESIARTLVTQGVDVDARDERGRSLLYKAALRGDVFSCKFLIDQEARLDVRTCDPARQDTALHVIAAHTSPPPAAPRGGPASATCDSLVDVAQYMVSKGADPNVRDSDGKTAHRHLQGNDDDDDDEQCNEK